VSALIGSLEASPVLLSMTTLVDCYIHLDSKTQRWWLEHDKQDFQLLTLRGFHRSSSFRSESMLVRSECKDQVPEFLKVKNYRDDNESPSISRDLKSHIEHVGRVLDHLLRAKLHAKPSNCDLIFSFRENIELLWYISCQKVYP
jgi:hypothetical protein